LNDEIPFNIPSSDPPPLGHSSLIMEQPVDAAVGTVSISAPETPNQSSSQNTENNRIVTTAEPSNIETEATTRREMSPGKKETQLQTACYWVFSSRCTDFAAKKIELHFLIKKKFLHNFAKNFAIFRFLTTILKNMLRFPV